MKTTKDTKRGTAKRPAAKKTKATARTVAKSGETARDYRPLEERYREARDHFFNMDDNTRDWFKVYQKLDEVWNGEAERYKRDEVAYEEKDAELIREAFENELSKYYGRAELVYNELPEREKRRAAGLYNSEAYNLADGIASVESYAQGRAEGWADGLSEETLAAASEREFYARVRGEEDELAKRRKGEPIYGVSKVILEYDIKRYGWEKLVIKAGLVRHDDRFNLGNWHGGDVFYVTPEEDKRLQDEMARKIAEEATKKAEAKQRKMAEDVGRAVLKHGLVGTVAPSPSGTSAPVAGLAAKPSAIVSKLAGKSLQYTKNGRRLSCVFVRTGKIGGDGGELKRGGKPYPGVTFFFGKFGTQEPLYAESQRTITFTEELIQAFVKRHEGNGDGWAKLPEDVTSRNARTKLFRGWTKSVTDKITYGRGDRKGYARLDLPEVWL